MSNPILVEIVAYAPTAYYHCSHCEVAWREMGASNRIHDEQVRSSLPPDLTQDYQAVSDWVREVFRLYCDQVTVKVIDAASLEGVVKTLRHGLHHYPAILVNGRKHTGREALEAAGRELAAALQPDRSLAT